ncbi:hypothetical protein [Tenacibaculum halocynthiae]|uniref:hypothetical protein n=1 Tax=Tenacibaculum halocynthiae TaxID=1254437 RepID=UPI0038945C95
MAKEKLEDHTAGPQSIGFDYQFYYFMYLALELKVGEKVGFEVKDDVHIDKSDGSTVLFQAKHSVQKNTIGNIKNLTELDIDLWKTLNNWITFIQADSKFIEKHSFILVTNKNEGNNDFVEAIRNFKKSENVNLIFERAKELKNKTTDKTLKKYINTFLKMGKRKLKPFIKKLDIETSVDEIIKKIKNRILQNVRQEKFVEIIYNNLYSNLQAAKYLEIKNKNKFEISFQDFNKRFGKCFKIANEKTPLPSRNFPIILPENIENQTFVKQLLDIEETQIGSNDIKKYTTHMLKFINDFTYWTEEENFILFTEAEEFKKSSIEYWANEFKSKFRKINKQINNGAPIESFEEKIKDLGIELVDFIRRKELIINGIHPLSIEHSNGHFYALSNELEIGWHLDWEKKYKKQL